MDVVTLGAVKKLQQTMGISDVKEKFGMSLPGGYLVNFDGFDNLRSMSLYGTSSYGDSYGTFSEAYTNRVHDRIRGLIIGVNSSSLNVYSYDPISMVEILLGKMTDQINTLFYDDVNQILIGYYTTSKQFIIFDCVLGQQIAKPDIFPNTPVSIHCATAYNHGDQKLYVVDNVSTNNLWECALATGTWTNRGTLTGVAGAASGIAFDPIHRSIFSLDNSAPTLYRWNVDDFTKSPIAVANTTGTKGLFFHDKAGDKMYIAVGDYSGSFKLVEVDLTLETSIVIVTMTNTNVTFPHNYFSRVEPQLIAGKFYFTASSSNYTAVLDKITGENGVYLYIANSPPYYSSGGALFYPGVGVRWADNLAVREFLESPWSLETDSETLLVAKNNFSDTYVISLAIMVDGNLVNYKLSPLGTPGDSLLLYSKSGIKLKGLSATYYADVIWGVK